MARNEEKANSILNRYLAAKEDEKRGNKPKRPHLATECHDLNEADKWRQQILREIGRKVMEIQNAGLGEHRIRDLNDEINKLIREKGHWERRILELGGPDYAKVAQKVTDSSGLEIQDGQGAGYRYFGAAKDLPGVKELFEKPQVKVVKRTRHQLYKSIDPDYYGFRDEEDGLLAKLEPAAEAELRRKAIEEWEATEQERQKALKGVSGEAVKVGHTGDEDGQSFIAYVPLPEQKEIEKIVLQKKKADLLSKYASEALQQQQQEARLLLNRQQD